MDDRQYTRPNYSPGARASLELLRRGSSTDVEPLHASILDEGGLRPLVATDGQHTTTFFIFEVVMHIWHEHFAHAILHQVDKMQAHLVLICKAIGFRAQTFAAVGHPDQQSAPLRIQEARNGPQNGKLNLVIMLAGMKIGAQGRLKLDRVPFTGGD